MLKVLDKMIIKGFIGPCLLAFFVVEFVLIMQTMWKVIDDILGKGYGFGDYFELLFLFSIVLIPMALPLTVLLASTMVYGDLAEKHELGSMKSSGVSLIRILKPGLIIAIGVAMFSLLASNSLKPRAMEGYLKKIRNMKTNQLTFAFDDKIFNTDFKNYSIRIDKKAKDGRSIEGALIYDHSDADKSIVNVIRAKTGEMYTSPDQKYLIMDLNDGYQFKEVRSEAADVTKRNFKLQGRPVMRTHFSSLRKVFDLEELMDLNMSSSNYKVYETMNSNQLIEVIDSITVEIEEKKKENLHVYTFMEEDSVLSVESREDDRAAQYQSINIQAVKAKAKTKTKRFAKGHTSTKYKFQPDLINENTNTLSDVISLLRPDEFLKAGKRSIDSYMTNVANHKYEEKRLDRNRSLHAFTLHRMFSWACVCLIFLFIGAPSGALVRKGGFGYPMLIAIGFYLTFVMSTIIGEKLIRNGTLAAWEGAWLPCFLLLPFAVILTWRALNDKTQLIDINFKKILNRSSDIKEVKLEST